MRLEEILYAVARLTAEERQQLREYLNQFPGKSSRLSAEDRMQRLNAALGAMGAGLSPTERENMTAAMTGESSEPSEGSAGENASKA